MAVGAGVLLGLLVAANARLILSLFVRAEPQMQEAVLDGATKFLYYMCAGTPVLYLLFVLRHSLQGMGNTRVPFMTGVVELVARISLGLLLPPLMGISGVYVAEISAWIADTLLLAVGVRKTLSELEQTGRGNPGEWRK
jgi:Na+-driven multidrug efflux pump